MWSGGLVFPFLTVCTTYLGAACFLSDYYLT